MLKKISKISVLTVIAALFVFAFAGAAFAEETDEELLVQPAQIEEHELPVGGWAPAEPIYVPTDLVVNNGSSTDKKRKSKSRTDSELDVFKDGVASTGYNALDDGQRELYDAIDVVANGFMNANEKEKLEPTEVSEDGEDVVRYIIGEIKYNQTENSDQTEDEIAQKKQDALKAYYAYDYDHPAYYWLSNLILYSNDYLYPCTEEEYASASERKRIDDLVRNGVEAYVEVASKGTNALDKIALVHDQIVNDIDYAYKKDGKTPVEEKWAHSVHGVFDPQIKHAVCEGYADAFALIMNCMEISNYYIVGEAGAGGPGGGNGHAWNAVKDDATGTYLYMDLTWDDWGENGYSYEYFGMPMTNFEVDHHKYNADAEQAKDWLYNIDNIDGKYNDSFLGTYYNRGGFYYEKESCEWDAEKFAQEAKAKAARAGGWVSVLCTDEDSIDEITSVLGETKGGTVTYQYDENTIYKCAYFIAPAEPKDYKHEHAWTEPIYIWAPDYKTVTAKRVCSHATGNSCTETETANATSKITRAATYTAKGQTTYTAAFANPVFKAQAKTVTNIPMLAKKANPMKVKATAKTVKVKALKKKALTVVPLKVTSAKGKVTYKVVGGNAKSKKSLKLNAKTGKVTVKKKTKKGKYQIKVKVTAAGATAYKALSKTVKVTINAK